MRNIKMNLQFDGSRYLDWQRLGDSDNTIQGKLENLLTIMVGEKINLIGSSRTDKGVHAEAYTCNFFTSSPMNIEEMETYINNYLPDDIIAYKLEEVDERFHSRYRAKSKLYSYQIDNGKHHNVFTRRYTSHIDHKLDIDLMKEAASYLVGTFDFTSFTTMKSKKKSYEKTIYSIDIYRKDAHIFIDFLGNGFLHNMIRIITGSLIRVGKKDLRPGDIKAILQARDRSLAGPIAEAKGLTLIKANY